MRADHREESKAAVPVVDAVNDYKPSATDFTWDSHFFLDDMPSPQFSDSVSLTILLMLNGFMTLELDVQFLNLTRFSVPSTGEAVFAQCT